MDNVVITIGSYVVAIRDINEVRKQSIGLVGDISEKKIAVFFIGANKIVETDINHVAYLDIERTGKPYKQKICNRCHLLKNDIEDFEINQTDAKGRKTTRPTCRECRVEIDGEPLKSEEKKRLDAIKPKGIFTCPICQKTSIAGVTAKFVIDHDHKTGMGREWICDSCNTGLGRFSDNATLIQRVIDYLKKIFLNYYDHKQTIIHQQ